MSEAKIKVLVVEDEASIRKFIAINLERSGFTVLEAETGEKALEMARAYRPEVMVLDDAARYRRIRGMHQMRDEMPNSSLSCDSEGTGYRQDHRPRSAPTITWSPFNPENSLQG